jgi:hypothetical protein
MQSDGVNTGNVLASTSRWTSNENQPLREYFGS